MWNDWIRKVQIFNLCMWHSGFSIRLFQFPLEFRKRFFAMIQVVDIQIDFIGSGPIWFKILGMGFEWWPKAIIQDEPSQAEKIQSVKNQISDLNNILYQLENEK